MADVLRCLTYADGYGQFALGRERYLELAQASTRCADCAGCTVNCPHGVDVVEPRAPRAGPFRMRVPALMLSALLASGSAVAQSILDCRIAPGWEQSGAIRQYDSGNLFEYKDGGAEGYLIFGFVRMSTVDCKSGQNTLTIDLSEMTDPDAAYGLFAANLDPTSPISQIGMGGQVQAQSATFAKGNFYIEIVEVAADAGADDSSTLRSMASTLEVRLPGRATPPAQLRWFPPDNVAPVRMVPESVLGLRELKRGYVARYRVGQAFIVLASTPESAALVLKAIREHFPGAVPAPVGDEAWMSSTQYLGGICIFRKGRVLAGYSNLPTPQQAATLAALLAGRIP